MRLGIYDACEYYGGLNVDNRFDFSTIEKKEVLQTRIQIGSRGMTTRIGDENRIENCGKSLLLMF